MEDIYTKIFNSNMIMHISFFMMGISITEIHNFYFDTVYSVIYLFLCILIMPISWIIFLIQYNKNNQIGA